MHYQISYDMGTGTETETFLCCRLMIDGTEVTSARSIDGAGKYGTSSGTWIGEITGAGSPVIKVQCRNSDAIDLWEDYHTKAQRGHPRLMCWAHKLRGRRRKREPISFPFCTQVSRE